VWVRRIPSSSVGKWDMGFVVGVGMGTSDPENPAG